VVVAVVNVDYLDTRNLLPAWVPLMTVVAAGLVSRPLGLAGLAALALIALVSVVGVWLEPRWQREDWRGMAEALPALSGARAIVLPATGRLPIELYLPRLTRLPQAGAPVREVALMYPVRRKAGEVHPLPPPRIPAPRYGNGFRVVERRTTESYSLLIVRAPRPAPFGVAAALTFRPSQGEPTAVLLQR
jgi:hypothetical protein